MVECISVSLSVTKKWPPVGLLVMYICCPNCTGFSLLLTLAGTWLALASEQRHQLKASYNHNECILLWWWWLTVKCWYMLIRLVIEDGCLSVCHTIVISLRAECCRRKARREKFTHENCTLSTIHLGPAGWRPAWAWWWWWWWGWWQKFELQIAAS